MEVRGLFNQNSNDMFVYKIINIVNDKIYVGCTTRELEKRLYAHFGQRFHNKRLLSRAIIKYGIDKFKISLIEQCASIDEMFEREKYWIGKLKSADPSIGYNLTLGGDAGPSLLGKNHPMFGKKRPDLTELNKKRKGLELSVDHRQKIIESLIGRKHDEVTKAKIANSTKEGWENGVYKDIPNKISVSRMGKSSWNKGRLRHNSGKNSGPDRRAFAFVSPDNILYEGTGIKHFCAEMGNLHDSGFYALLRSKIKSYKWWRLPNDNDVYDGIGLFPDNKKSIAA